MHYPVHSQNYYTSDGYNNDYDQALSFSCGSYKAVNSIKSRHRNKKEDRQFRFTCGKVTSCNNPFTTCYWSQYANRWRKPFAFTCAKNHVLAGLYSYHRNRKEDRRWKFRCCRAKNYVTKSCESTPYLNNYDKDIDFHAKNRVFIGMHSKYRRRKK